MEDLYRITKNSTEYKFEVNWELNDMDYNHFTGTEIVHAVTEIGAKEKAVSIVGERFLMEYGLEIIQSIKRVS